ncbi:unnamed protein product [Closterium sp. Yama58-4]|nr:unnamed protein product [Closterium sp. Yama58-4]
MTFPWRRATHQTKISALRRHRTVLPTWLLVAALLAASRAPLTASQRISSHTPARRHLAPRADPPPLGRESFASAYARTKVLAGDDKPVFLRPIAANRPESQASRGSRTRSSRSLIRLQQGTASVGNPNAATMTTAGAATAVPRGVAAIFSDAHDVTAPSASSSAAANHALAATAGPLGTSGATGGGRKAVTAGRGRNGPIGISPHWSASCTGRACGVMERPISVYVVWYGAFSETQKQMVRSLTASLSPHADPSVTVPLWWNINRLYYDSSGNHISESVTWGGEVEDANYSRGKTLSDADVRSLITNAISSNQLPYNEDGVYFVLSDETVSQMWNMPGGSRPAFCASFCGWHWDGRASSFGSIVYSWVGNAATLCPRSCITRALRASEAAPPNQDAGMDGLLSVFAHELAEATSSPFVATWFDESGEENADKCSWE